MFEVRPPQLSTNNGLDGQGMYLLFIERQLRNLGEYIDQFEKNLILFNICTDQIVLNPNRLLRNYPNVYTQKELHSAWRITACRDSSIIMFNFERTMNAIKASLIDVPELMRLVDHDLLRKAEKLFRSYFPDFKGLRHTVGHTAEFFGTPGKRSAHSITGSVKTSAISAEGSESIIIIDFIENRRFLTTFDKRLVSLEMSIKTKENLGEVAIMFYAGFDAVSSHFTDMTRD